MRDPFEFRCVGLHVSPLSSVCTLKEVPEGENVASHTGPALENWNVSVCAHARTHTHAHTHTLPLGTTVELGMERGSLLLATQNWNS